MRHEQYGRALHIASPSGESALATVSIIERDGIKGSSNVFAINNLPLYYFVKKVKKTYKTSSKEFLNKCHT